MVGGNSTTPATRKRTRIQNDEEPSSTSTAKKRRTRKPSEQEAQDSVDVDGVDGIAPNGTVRRGRSVRNAPIRNDAPPDDAWAVPDTEEKPRKQPKETRPAKEPKRSKQPTATAQRSSSVYDVPESGEDELSTATITPRHKRQKPGAAAAAVNEVERAPTAVPATNGAVLPKRKPGRPRKRPLEAQTEPQNGLVGLVASAESSTSLSHDHAPAKGKRAADPEVPKGILTPRKQRDAPERVRKSVAFDSKPDEEALQGLAVGTPSKSARKRTEAAEIVSKPAVLKTLSKNGREEASDEGSGSDEEDDEVCAICSKPDSEPPNEIVFCDNCDMPVHQECYGLAELPEGDWICRNCSQDDATSTTHGAAGQVQATVIAREDQRPDIPNFDRHLRSAQRILLDRCAGRRRIKLHGQDEAYKKVYQLVEQTVVAGEGNSMMVIGARGCGKTTLVESIMTDVSKEHDGQFHVVRLSGFIHTDDKLALREIWRQLGREMEVEDELVSKTTNYADTMASLLALLSHPSEIAETQDGVTSKSIIFVIDEFDLFATHARQTLLYNLFDIAQARKAPIAVLGLTTRIDVVESLEKRVKSRFSHRYVYLSLPKSIPAYWDVCKQGLSIDEEDMAGEGIDVNLKGHRNFWEWWNGKVESLRKTSSFTDHLESHFYSTKSVSAFLTTCILPLAALSPTNPSLQIPPTTGLGVSLEPPDSKLHLLGSLSDLDLAMLIAAARLDIVAHTDTVNFAMAYDEYTSLMGKQRVQSATSGMLALGGGARVWGRGPAGIAWERLVALGLLVPAAAGGRGTAGLGGLDSKMWKMDVALEEIPAAVKLNAVLARWCKEI